MTHKASRPKAKVVFSCRHNIPLPLRAVIKWLHADKQISTQELSEVFNVHRTTISRCIKDETNFHQRGRPVVDMAVWKARQAKVQDVLERRNKAGKRLHPSSRAVAAVLKKENPDDPWSKTMVLRVIKKTGGRYYRMPRVPWLTDEQREERMTFAQKYMDNTQPKIHVDEAYVTVNSSVRGGVYWWKDDGEYEASPHDFNRHDNFPVKLFVFGAVGVGFKHLKIIRMDGKKKDDDDGPAVKGLNANMYVRQCLAGPVMNQLLETESVLIQDNAGPHRAKSTQKYLAGKGVQLFEDRLPPKSCDINIPIERMWALLKRRVSGDGCDTVDELVESVQRHWAAIPQATVDKLCAVAAWRERCRDVEVAAGWFTWGKRAKDAVPA